MLTKISLFLIFHIFSLSFQTIKVAIFCDDHLKEIYVVKGNEQIEIAKEPNLPTGGGPNPYYFYELNAVPGDLIRFKCFNIMTITFGAGCFVLDNNCYCYDFNPNLPKGNYVKTLYARFGDISCGIEVQSLEDESSEKNHFYEHYIPLDVSKLSCINTNNVLICLKGVNCDLKLFNYITADFDIKNLECIITENYDYFSLNNEKLEENQKFSVLNELMFKSEEAKKIHVKFRNYGKVFAHAKECEFSIRICH